jgi:hypothetical protein
MRRKKGEKKDYVCLRRKALWRGSCISIRNVERVLTLVHDKEQMIKMRGEREREMKKERKKEKKRDR